MGNAGEITNVLFNKSTTIKKQRETEHINFLKQAYNVPKLQNNNDYTKGYMYIKPKDGKSTLDSEAFRFNLRNEIIEFFKTLNKQKKEMDAKELKQCIENDDFSLKYTLCEKSRDHILNKFYFDIEQSKINQMVQEETDQHI